MGRRSTELEPAWHCKQKLKSLARVRPAGTLPWLGFDRMLENGSFSRGSIVESTRWMLLYRPVELAAFARWDEKAGLPRDAIRSQCWTCSKHEKGNRQ